VETILNKWVAVAAAAAVELRDERRMLLLDEKAEATFALLCKAINTETMLAPNFMFEK
jgi:hypothetical protein